MAGRSEFHPLPPKGQVALKAIIRSSHVHGFEKMLLSVA
jgi:hypothetical protein